MPKRLQSGSEAHAFQSAEKFFEQQYFALIDTALGSISTRFVSDTFQFLSDVEHTLLNDPFYTWIALETLCTF
jgi:hypothetical protein